MASWGYVSLAAILIVICLDVSSIVSATVLLWPWDAERYYDLARGPVLYEPYYPNIRKTANQQKPVENHVDRNAVLERSFQVPFERLAYSAGNANRRVPATTNGSLVVITDNENTPSNEQRREEAIKSERDYDIGNKIAPFHRRPIIIDNYNGDPQNANIDGISKLVRRAISRDLENWNALERYLERANNQIDRFQSGLYDSREISEGEKGFGIDRRSYDSSEQSDFNVLDKSETRDANRPSNYLEKIVSENAMSDARVADAASPIISDSLPAENIFEPRPQVIRYTFFKKPTTQLEDKTTIDTTPRNYGDNLIREEIADSRPGKQEENDIKVTSIEISELPRHKTRHHHGEWAKRDYSNHRHRSESGDRSIV